MSTHTLHTRQFSDAAEPTTAHAAAESRRPLSTNDKRLIAFIAVGAASILSVAAGLVWACQYYWSVMG